MAGLIIILKRSFRLHLGLDSGQEVVSKEAVTETIEKKRKDSHSVLKKDR